MILHAEVKKRCRRTANPVAHGFKLTSALATHVESPWSGVTRPRGQGKCNLDQETKTQQHEGTRSNVEFFTDVAYISFQPWSANNLTCMTGCQQDIRARNAY